MCRTCWEEHGSPTNRSPTIDKAVQLIYIIYEDNEVGMPLHTALDDWNIETKWERWSDHQDAVSEIAWEAAGDLCDIMNAMTIEDRASALAYASAYF